MAKKENKKLGAFLVLALLAGGAFGLTDGFTTNPFVKDIDEGIVEEVNNNGPIGLNATRIKLKNVGDTFTLTATVNENASFKGVTFSTSDESAISITKINDTSVKLTKLTYFENYVTITAKSDDPFVNVTSTCQVRSYNSFVSFDTINFTKVVDSEGNAIPEITSTYYEDEVLLKKGLTYSMNILINTQFSQFNEDIYEESHANTYLYIEDDDMAGLKTVFETAFGNTMTSFVQDLGETSLNRIKATFTYTNEIDLTSTGDYYSNVIKYQSKQKTVRCYAYQEASSLNFNQSGVVVL